MNILVRVVASATFLTAAPSAQAIVFPIQHDQNNNCVSGGTSSQEFEPVYNAAFDDVAADDVIVPAGDFGWDLRQIFVDGSYSSGEGPMPAVNVVFHHDAGGKPGAEVAGCRYDDLVPGADVAGDLSISLPSPCILRIAGDANTKYWVVVQARMDQGLWYWSNRSVQSSSPAAYRNPGDGFLTGCTDWGARGADCGLDATNPDQCFTVLGYDGLFSNGFEIGNTSLWSDAVVN